MNDLDVAGSDSVASEGAMVTFRVEVRAIATPAITYPADGETLVGDRIAITGTGTPGHGVVPIVDGVRGDLVSVASDGRWSAQTPSLQPGPHRIAALQRYGESEGAATVERTVTLVSPTGTTVSDESGRVTLEILSVGQPLIHTPAGETSVTTFKVTAKTLPYNPEHRLAVTLVQANYLDTMGAVFGGIGKAVPHGETANTQQTDIVTLAYDGRNTGGAFAAARTTLTQEATATTGFVMRGPQASAIPIDTEDPRSPFYQLDTSTLERVDRPLVFAPLKTSAPLGGGPLVLDPFASHWLPILCRASSQEITRSLGDTSRALADMTYCCDPGPFGRELRVVATEDRSDARPPLVYFVTSSGCSGTGTHPNAACGTLPNPISPFGEACATSGGSLDVNRDGMPDIGFCKLSGLDLLPPRGNGFGDEFPLLSMLRSGPVKLSIYSAATGVLLNEISARLGSYASPERDSDGDGQRDRFDSCLLAAEELRTVQGSGGQTLLCGPRVFGEAWNVCKQRYAADSDGDCVGDACDCHQALGRPTFTPVECEASACDGSESRCLNPPPRIPTANNDPLGDRLDTDQAKAPDVTVLPDGTLSVFGHVQRACDPATDASCWYPALLRWVRRTTTDDLNQAVGWVRTDLSTALAGTSNLAGYWEQQRQALFGPPLSDAERVRQFDALSGIDERRQAALFADGRISPRIAVASPQDRSRTDVAFVLYDARADSVPMSQERRRDLEALHGVPGHLGTMMVASATVDASSGSLRFSPPVNVETGAAWPYDVSASAQPSVWTAGSDLQVDAAGWYSWVSALCGPDRALCVWNVFPGLLGASTSPITVRIDDNFDWIDTSVAADPAGDAVIVAATKGPPAVMNDTVLFRCTWAGCFRIFERDAHDIGSLGVYRPRVAFGPDGIVLYEAHELTLTPDTLDPRLAVSTVYMATPLRGSPTAPGTLEPSYDEARYFSGYDARNTPAFLRNDSPVCLLGMCPLASLSITPLGQGDFPPRHHLAYDGDLVLQDGQTGTRTPVYEDVNIGGFHRVIEITPGHFVFVAKDSADSAYVIGAVAPERDCPAWWTRVSM